MQALQIQAPIEIVAIGVSTGGPQALTEVIPYLPANLAVPVVIVQHMPQSFTGALAASLNDKSVLTPMFKG
jgi:two-component system chemotaxis response regulator CheB